MIPKPINRPEYLNLTPKEQEKYIKVPRNGVDWYYPKAIMQVQYTPNETPSFKPSFAYLDDPQQDPILPIEVDLAFIEGFLSSNQYLTQSRRFRNIQISHNQQQREIETLKKNLNKTANHLRDSEKDVQQLVAQNNKQLVDIENLKAELAEIKKQLKETKKKPRAKR